MDKITKNKRSLELVTSLSPGWVQNVCRKIPFELIYHLANFAAQIQSGFWVIPKITFANLCKAYHDVIIIPASAVLSNLKNPGQGEGKLQKTEYLENEKSFLDEIKSIFHNFWRAFFWQSIDSMRNYTKCNI